MLNESFFVKSYFSLDLEQSFIGVSLSVYLGLSRPILDYLRLSGTIWDYPGHSANICDYLALSESILDYLGLFGAIWNYRGLSWTILDYLRLSGTILVYLGLPGTICD